jgi:hypothetical protein
MAALASGKTEAGSVDTDGYTNLLRKLAEGWRIQPPVYVMTDPLQRDRVVFRMALWCDGRPQVATIPDGPEIRQFIADRALDQQRL